MIFENHRVTVAEIAAKHGISVGLTEAVAHDELEFSKVL
jgi:hypothetical protein